MPLAPLDLLRTLADGVDYRTGEVLAQEHLLNDFQAIRALHWALEQYSTLQKELKAVLSEAGSSR